MLSGGAVLGGTVTACNINLSLCLDVELYVQLNQTFNT